MDIEQFMVGIEVSNGSIFIRKIRVVLEGVPILNNTFLTKINGSCVAIIIHIDNRILEKVSFLSIRKSAIINSFCTEQYTLPIMGLPQTWEKKCIIAKMSEPEKNEFLIFSLEQDS